VNNNTTYKIYSLEQTPWLSKYLNNKRFYYYREFPLYPVYLSIDESDMMEISFITTENENIIDVSKLMKKFRKSKLERLLK